jgi:hypothetical protein
VHACLNYTHARFEPCTPGPYTPVSTPGFDRARQRERSTLRAALVQQHVDTRTQRTQRMHTHVHTRAHAHVHVRRCECVRARVRVCVCARVRACARACVRAWCVREPSRVCRSGRA